MNVATLRERVGAVLEHAPNNETWRRNFLADLNRENSTLLLGAPWRFRYRTWRFKTTPQVSFGYDDWRAAAGALSLGGRSIILTGCTTPDFADLTDRFNIMWATWALQGAVITPPTTIAADLTEYGYGSSSFVVEAVVQQIGPQFVLHLDPRWQLIGGKTSSHTGAWSIGFPRYPLPRDLGQIDTVWLVDDDGLRTPLAPWGRSEEAMAGRQADPRAIGTPSSWALDVPGQVPITESFSSKYRTAHDPLRATQDRIPPPVRVPAAAASPGGTGSLPIGTRIQYCHTWAWAGLESGPGPVVEITLTGSDNTVDLSNLEVLADDDFGRYRPIYRRFGEGRWQLVAVLTDPTPDTWQDAGGAYDPSQFDGQPILDDRHLTPNVQQQFLRLYPQPDDFQHVEIRYLATPRKLESDQDEPEIPGGDAMHEILVHLVCARRLAQMGSPDLSRVQQRFANELIGILSRSELTQTTQPIVMGSGRMPNVGGLLVGPIRWDGG